MKEALKRRKEETVTNTKSVGSFLKKRFDRDTLKNTRTTIHSSLESKTKESNQTQEINCN